MGHLAYMPDIDRRKIKKGLKKAKDLEEKDKKLHSVKELKAEDRIFKRSVKKLRSFFKKK